MKTKHCSRGFSRGMHSSSKKNSSAAPRSSFGPVYDCSEATSWSDGSSRSSCETKLGWSLVTSREVIALRNSSCGILRWLRSTPMVCDRFALRRMTTFFLRVPPSPSSPSSSASSAAFLMSFTCLAAKISSISSSGNGTSSSFIFSQIVPGTLRSATLIQWSCLSLTLGSRFFFAGNPAAPGMPGGGGGPPILPPGGGGGGGGPGG
mmetsp:Transcript_64420/g.151720  ORF Transcript_64420/g.151720 Transcript_64420/m.151720 type:complete len:206 (-) Transcript_64420:6-623(-)